MANDIFAGTPLDGFFDDPGFGDPAESRVAPKGHTTHHDFEAYDEYTSKINPPEDMEDPNNPYQKVEAAMNHVDTRWGENYDEPFNCMHSPHERYPHAHHPEVGHNVVVNDRAHHINHRPKHVVIDTPAMEQLTPADVDEVYGYTEHNMKLLRVASVRVSNLTNVLKEIQETDHGIDLVRIMEQVPFASVSFREILEEAFNVEMKNYLEIINKLNTYIYGEPPEIDPVEPEPEPTPEDPEEPVVEPEDPEPTGDEGENEENKDVNTGEQDTNGEDTTITDDNGQTIDGDDVVPSIEG
jgi:hypothetical protein